MDLIRTTFSLCTLSAALATASQPIVANDALELMHDSQRDVYVIELTPGDAQAQPNVSRDDDYRHHENSWRMRLDGPADEDKQVDAVWSLRLPDNLRFGNVAVTITYRNDGPWSGGQSAWLATREDDVASGSNVIMHTPRGGDEMTGEQKQHTYRTQLAGDEVVYLRHRIRIRETRHWYRQQLLSIHVEATPVAVDEEVMARLKKPDDLAVQRELSFDDGKVTDIGRWQADDRTSNRTGHLWRYYMHGLVDHFAQPIPWSAVLSDEQASAHLVADELDTPYKQSTLPAVRLSNSDRLELAKPLPIDMDQARGKTVRLYLWMRGDNAGMPENIWHTPNMIMQMRDAEGDVIAGSRTRWHTAGTFPYHCYYVDRFVPESAAGIHLELYNRVRGDAYFSTLSWELVDETNELDDADKQDPYTGSLAANPWYDQMPPHIQRASRAAEHPWNFLRGAAVGLKGQPFDITTLEGLEAYFHDPRTQQPMHRHHALMYFPRTYRAATSSGAFEDFEDGWLDKFASLILEAQDEETGYWRTESGLEMGLTFHYADMLFRYYAIERTDREDVVNPAMSIGLKYLPRAEQIIDTTLMMQSTYESPSGERRRAAWGRAAYGYTENPDDYEQNADFGTTWDAIYLIRLAARYVDEERQAKVYDAVRDATRYVLKYNVLEDGAWKQRDTDDHPTSSHYMMGILQDAHLLEWRIDPDLSPPVVRASRAGEALRFTWDEPTQKQTAVRVYLVPSDVPTSQVNERYLAGIIHKTGDRVHEMDPLIAVDVIRQAGADRWGMSFELPSEDTWQGRRYLPWKLRQIDRPIPHVNDGEPLELTPAASPDELRIFVAAVTWYGEQSELVELELE